MSGWSGHRDSNTRTPKCWKVKRVTCFPVLPHSSPGDEGGGVL